MQLFYKSEFVFPRHVEQTVNIATEQMTRKLQVTHGDKDVSGTCYVTIDHSLLSTSNTAI